MFAEKRAEDLLDSNTILKVGDFKMVKADIIINLELNGEDAKKFEEVKLKLGISKPNTEILRECITEKHQRLFS